MLSDDNNSGILTFMIGLIVIVMVGVGISVLVDSRFSLSRNTRDLESVITSNKEDILRLTAMLDESQSQVTSQEPKLKADQKQLKTLQAAIDENQAKLRGFTVRRDEISKFIPTLEEQFRNYRERYREQAWVSAVGESLGNLEVRGGRTFQNSVITRVTEVGLEIRHDNGIARIQGPDLNDALQDRFQWNDAERMRRLQKESADHDAIADSDPAAPKPPKPAPVKRAVLQKPSAASLDQAKIDAARKKVIGWKSRVSQLSSDRSTAQSNASNSQPSVPGSLETWQARASRLTTELAKAKGELAAAKSELELVSPGDSLLRPDPGSF